MKKEYLNIISNNLRVAPVKINSEILSAQNRVRYYWFNWKSNLSYFKKDLIGKDYDGVIVDMSKKLNREFTKKDSSGIVGVAGYYGNNSNSQQRVYSVDKKMPTLLVNNTGGNNPLWITLDGESAYRASIEFCEWLQNVPKNYTEGVSLDKRYKLLGNAWTVDVIANIIKDSITVSAQNLTSPKT